MPKFTVIVTEIIEYTVEVDAVDASDACFRADCMFIETADRQFDGQVIDREVEAIAPKARAPKARVPKARAGTANTQSLPHDPSLSQVLSILPKAES